MLVALTFAANRRWPHPAWPAAMAPGPPGLVWAGAINAGEIGLVATVIVAARTMAIVPAAATSLLALAADEAILVLRWGHESVTAVACPLLGGAAPFALVITPGRLREEQARTRTALEELRVSREARVEAARGAERVRLARETRDVLGHTLSALAVQLEGARPPLERERATRPPSRRSRGPTADRPARRGRGPARAGRAAGPGGGVRSRLRDGGAAGAVTGPRRRR